LQQAQPFRLFISFARQKRDTAAAAGEASIIDPKRRDFWIYRGATPIKPNQRELAEATHRGWHFASLQKVPFQWGKPSG
jgi:bifunctional ADP-heptose synthase (sugar kinase/adenylyltransferase)